MIMESINMRCVSANSSNVGSCGKNNANSGKGRTMETAHNSSSVSSSRSSGRESRRELAAVLVALRGVVV